MSAPELAFDLRMPGALPTAAVTYCSSSSVQVWTGPSGAGKTRLLRAVAGFEPSAHGVVDFAGERWREGRVERVPPFARGARWCPQDARVFPHLRVEQNLAFGGGDPGEVEEVAAALGLSGLLGESSAGLSGGEAQRIALGRTILSAGRLWLLDEPFAALPHRQRADLAAFVVERAARQGVVLVVVTHDLEVASVLDGDARELTADGLVPLEGS